MFVLLLLLSNDIDLLLLIFDFIFIFNFLDFIIVTIVELFSLLVFVSIGSAMEMIAAIILYF